MQLLKKFRLILIFLFSLLTIFALTSCQGTSTTSKSHTHSWGSGKIVSSPSCVKDGKRMFTCSCGETRTQTIPALGKHIIDNGCCVMCGKLSSSYSSSYSDVELIPHEVFYEISEDGTYAIATGYNCGTDDYITIATSYEGLPVTTISFGENNTYYALESVTIPDSVTTIGDASFANCSGLTNITIPDSVKTIGKSAFEGCRGLTDITIPNGVKTIGYSAFKNCSSLTSITIPNGVTSIAGHAFERCSELTSITIPNSVTNIDDGAFEGCGNLTSVTIPNSVTTIGMFAFEDCSSLTSITIPNSVTTIDDSAFDGCSGLSSVTMPTWAIEVIPGDNVKNVIINGGTSISHSAFSEYKNLTNITISNSITSVDSRAFDNCPNLQYNEYNNAYYLGDQSNPYMILVKNKSTSTTACTIQGSTKVIANSAFENCSNLSSIAIPNNITIIGDQAFDGCSSLTSLTIGNNVTTIGNNAFDGCSRLTSITIPDGVTTIGKWAFNSCSRLTSITIPGSVKNIGYHAFYGCQNLSQVCIKDIAAWCSLAFDRYESNPLYYAKNLYLNDVPVTNLVIPEGITYINSYAFSGCTGLTSVSIPKSITRIDRYAFSGCRNLTGVYIKDITAWCAINFSTYDTNPLYHAKKLYLNNSLVTNLVIPEGVTYIKPYAFINCTSLTSVTIERGITRIGTQAFYDCTNLKSATFKVTNGWWLLSTFYTTQQLSSSDVANTSTAAKYLRLYDYTWERS